MKVGETTQCNGQSISGQGKIVLVDKGRKYYTVRPFQGFHISTRSRRIPLSEMQTKEETKEWESEILDKFWQGAKLV